MTELKKLIEMAKEYAIKNNWEVIDKKIIPEILKYDHFQVADYLAYLFNDESGDVRDLAGTITAELEMDNLPYEKREEIKSFIQKGIKDPHPYARFRSTVAAIKHNMYDSKDLELMRETLESIEKNEEDETIKALASNSLKKLSKK